jgi:uncharacterized membrane protein YdjX (TVP38/TMEM64 family)
VIPFAKLLLESIPVIEHGIEVSFLSMPIALLLRFAGFIPLEALRITIGLTFGAPCLTWYAGVHPD